MEIQVRDSAEFGALLEALADELVTARIHFKLYQDLRASYSEYANELNQSNTFWSLTVAAHLDATILRLCKAYDQYPTSLNLRNLLCTICENLHFFDEPNFRDRLKGNPFVDSLAANTPKPDAAQLQKDIESVSSSDSLVKKLTIWRNNYYSHLNSRHALNPDTLARRSPLSVSDIDELLTAGVEILNRYSHMFNANLYSTSIVGRDDYKSILNAVRESVARYEAGIEEEWRQLGVKAEN